MNDRFREVCFVNNQIIIRSSKKYIGKGCIPKNYHWCDLIAKITA